MQQTLDTGLPDATQPPSRRPLVLTAVAGFLVGSTVLGLLWGLSGVHAGALEDAKAACEALDRVGTLPDTSAETGDRISTPRLAPETLHRVTAARELSAAAAQTNATYQPLADHIDGISRMVFSLHFNDLSGQRHVVQAAQLCAQL